MTAPANAMNAQQHRWTQSISEGTLQALKWLALALMVLDHANTYLADGAHRWAYEAGRMCLPLFAVVLAYNLARPKEDSSHYKRMLVRMVLAGLVASPALAWLQQGSLQQLNVMFSLAVCTGVVWSLQRGGTGSLFGLAIGLLLATQCEGGVPLLLIVAGLWMTFTGRSVLLARISLMGGISMLAFINQSVATIAPLLLLPFWQHLPKIKTMPRMKHLFYLFYPAHLYALAGISLALQ